MLFPPLNSGISLVASPEVTTTLNSVVILVGDFRVSLLRSLKTILIPLP